jgi:hypothetical protein
MRCNFKFRDRAFLVSSEHVVERSNVTRWAMACLDNLRATAGEGTFDACLCGPRL